MNGDKGIRTLDPLLARQVLSQLSYSPILNCKGLLILKALKGTRTLDLLITSQPLYQLSHQSISGTEGT